MWWEYLLVFGVGFFLGALVMSLAAMAHNSDRAMDRILKGGKG